MIIMVHVICSKKHSPAIKHVCNTESPSRFICMLISRLIIWYHAYDIITEWLNSIPWSCMAVKYHIGNFSVIFCSLLSPLLIKSKKDHQQRSMTWRWGVQARDLLPRILFGNAVSVRAKMETETGACSPCFILLQWFFFLLFKILTHWSRTWSWYCKFIIPLMMSFWHHCKEKCLATNRETLQMHRIHSAFCWLWHYKMVEIKVRPFRHEVLEIRKSSEGDFHVQLPWASICCSNFYLFSFLTLSPGLLSTEWQSTSCDDIPPSTMSDPNILFRKSLAMNHVLFNIFLVSHTCISWLGFLWMNSVLFKEHVNTEVVRLSHGLAYLKDLLEEQYHALITRMFAFTSHKCIFVIQEASPWSINLRDQLFGHKIGVKQKWNHNLGSRLY